MSNGSLDAHLFQSNDIILNWSTRYQIAIGVARGLCYLHQSCRECIIHCDIKPENILLDASFVSKIADFGMAAFVGRDFSRVLTTFRGTAGYLAPEWLSGVAITPKVDVYSFGMVLLELISGKRNTPEVYNSKSSYHVAFFPVQAINKLQEGDLQSLVDPQLQGEFDLEEAERVCKVAFWCIQDNECDRPTMGEVVHALEGLQELDMPPMPRLLAAITERSNAALVVYVRWLSCSALLSRAELLAELVTMRKLRVWLVVTTCILFFALIIGQVKCVHKSGRTMCMDAELISFRGHP
ncbi:G-type lectin S-receptor-like serine/threonine-protein kinase [Dichanthelium oligosanthes]|uniref:G-type lectin S-receptor-like serine/threonine-protein kinase n=1 Tax=Dichanthelium oligosanthes TaxID=888268 RepID=A0A1E5URQ0_9POAL|nr:G-type lectin S-receptor-like serine/threonine-protein kinase [Dichanthelium oligosanthes]